MKIDFIGLPGSGKTYLCGDISQKRDIKVISTSNNFEKLFFSAFFIIFHPVLFKKIITVLKIENNPKLFWYKVKHLLIEALANEQKANFYKKDILLDYGFAQFLISIYERNIETDEIDILWKYFNVNRFVYIIFADIKCREKRMENRKRIPRGWMPEEQHAKWFTVLDHNYKVIKSYLQTQNNVEYIVNNCDY